MRDNPFVYSLEKIKTLETRFLIIAGLEICEVDDQIMFTEDEVDASFDRIYRGLSEVAKGDDEVEAEAARGLLARLTIVPLRIH